MLKRVCVYLAQADYDFLASEAASGGVSMSNYNARLIMMARLAKYGAPAVAVVPLVAPPNTIEAPRPQKLFDDSIGEWRSRPPEKTEEEKRLERIATYQRIAAMSTAEPPKANGPESPRAPEIEDADHANAPLPDED